MLAMATRVDAGCVSHQIQAELLACFAKTYFLKDPMPKVGVVGGSLTLSLFGAEKAGLTCNLVGAIYPTGIDIAQSLHAAHILE